MQKEEGKKRGRQAEKVSCACQAGCTPVISQDMIQPWLQGERSAQADKAEHLQLLLGGEMAQTALQSSLGKQPLKTSSGHGPSSAADPQTGPCGCRGALQRDGAAALPLLCPSVAVRAGFGRGDGEHGPFEVIPSPAVTAP